MYTCTYIHTHRLIHLYIISYHIIYYTIHYIEVDVLAPHHGVDQQEVQGLQIPMHDLININVLMIY